jgi:hypothetical protein
MITVMLYPWLVPIHLLQKESDQLKTFHSDKSYFVKYVYSSL